MEWWLRAGNKSCQNTANGFDVLCFACWENVMSAQESKTARVKGGLSATRFANSFIPASAHKNFRDDPNAIRRGEVDHQRYDREVRSFYSEDEVFRRERLSGFMFKPYLFVFLIAVFIISLLFWLR